MDAAVAHLAGHGVAAEPVRVGPDSDKRLTFIADPDGRTVELYKW